MAEQIHPESGEGTSSPCGRVVSWQDALRGTPLSNISAILSSPVSEVNSSEKKEWTESPESSTVCCLRKNC